jgi:predicted CXXCH cytochrome family protein
MTRPTTAQSVRSGRGLGASAIIVMASAIAFLALVFLAESTNAATTSLAEVGPRYGLLPVVAAPSAGTKTLASAVVGGIHGPYTKLADECATCHRVHTGQNKNILKAGTPQSTLCFTCHDGTGASGKVKAEFTDPVVPQNNPALRQIYRHDTPTPSTHTSASSNEFTGVSNRHSECGDCHNAHKALGINGSPTTAGQTASARISGTTGVSVVNGAAGTPPAYTIVGGGATPLALEYQLCFKCHSGNTKLPPPIAGKPSTDLLDKAVEFNPNNPSFHPVEAAGKNQTQAMAASLAGPSPYKLWNFTPGSTIRCLNCHANGATPATPAPAADGVLAPHTSSNRGILLRNYKDRVLKSASEAYNSNDFALCYACHTDAPFTGSTSTATNFDLHEKHVSNLGGRGSWGGGGGSAGTDIDTPGAGDGNAICAECHFRLHSTTNKVGTQTVSGSRLVNFAPNVQSSSGRLAWTSTGTGSGSCTLTCHGKSHDGKSYPGRR